MRIKVQRGRGYVPASTRVIRKKMKRNRPSAGRRLLQPSQSVLPTMLSSACGLTYRLDKLVIEMETNGAIDPERGDSSCGNHLAEQLEASLIYVMYVDRK